MQKSSMFRDCLLFVAACAFGWWAHAAPSPVDAAQAAHAGASRNADAPPAAATFGGMSLEHALPGGAPSLAVYSASDHTIYVYPTQSGSAHINCAYMLHLDRAGAAIDRQNCAIGSVF